MIEVEKTVSPNFELVDPKAWPWYASPDLRYSAAGDLGGRTWVRRDVLIGVARPRDKGDNDEAALKVGRRTRFNMARMGWFGFG